MADAIAYPPHVIAAHHEAGHGVGAVLLSVPFESISIEGEGSGDGSFSTQLTWGEIQGLRTTFQGLRTTFSCVLEGFSRELSSHYIINTNCNALYSPIHYRKVANM